MAQFGDEPSLDVEMAKPLIEAAAAIIRSQDGHEEWTAARLRWAAHEHDSGFPPMFCRVARRCGQKLGIELYDPLYAMRGEFATFSFAEMHRPQEKALAVRAFPEARPVADALWRHGRHRRRRGVRGPPRGRRVLVGRHLL